MGYVNINKTFYETNYTPSQNTKVECKVVVLETEDSSEWQTSGGWIFGRCYYYQPWTSVYSFTAHCELSARNNWGYFVGSKYNDYCGSAETGTTYVISLSPTEFVSNSTSVAISNANFNDGSYTGFPIGGMKIVGGGYNTYSTYSVINLYYCKIWEGNTLVHNYIPKMYNNICCLYDTVEQTYIQPADPTKVTYVSSFGIDPSTKSFKASGGTQDFTVDAEADWSASTEDSWITLSAASGESGTSTVTVTVPSYSGVQKRQGTINFTSGDKSVDVTIKQRIPSRGSDTIRLGENALICMYLGNSQIESAYIGETQFWTNGPFSGIKITSSRFFKSSGGTTTVRLKSSDDWALTTNADWISFGQASGTSGTTDVTISAASYSSTTESRVGYITASTSGASAVCTVTQSRFSTIIIPENWHFLIVFQTSGANETVVLKGANSSYTYKYYDGENGGEMANGASAYTFTNAGLHPVFYECNRDVLDVGKQLFKNADMKIYGCYFNPTTMTGKYLPLGMFWNESLFETAWGSYLYIPEGMRLGDSYSYPSSQFNMGWFANLKTLVLPSTLQTKNSYYQDWTFCGFARCDTVYRFNNSNAQYITEFGYNNVADIGRLVTGTKTQYFPHGQQPYTGYAINRFARVEMPEGATMESMGLTRTTEEWWDEVNASV